MPRSFPTGADLGHLSQGIGAFIFLCLSITSIEFEGFVAIVGEYISFSAGVE